MGVLIDTNVLIEIERGRLSLAQLDIVKNGLGIGIAAITASELLHGVYRAKTVEIAEKRRQFVEHIFDITPIIPFEEAAARVHARTWATLQVQGHTIDAHDLIIAATALTLEWGVVTMNVRDFDRIPGLTIVDPR